MSGYELLYFNIEGRGETGETIRLIFHYLGKEFTDTRVEFNEWPAIKEDVSKVPCGFIPVLTIPTGEKLVQTTAIIRYLGNEFDLYGSNNVEKARVDAILDFNKELFDQTVEISFGSHDDTEKSKLIEELAKAVEKTYPYYERLLKENKTGPFFLGEKPSIADFYFYETDLKVYYILRETGYSHKYPLLKNLWTETGVASPELHIYLLQRRTRILKSL